MSGEQTQPPVEISRWEYYDILGAKKEDHLEELRKKRKKLALLYHPDKNKDEKSAQDKMQAINRAFEVLSNPLKRQIYDTFGVEALNHYENGNVSDVIWKIALYFTKPKAILNAAIFLFIVFIFLLFIPTLIGLKIDGVIPIYWIFVLLPIFIIDACIFVIVLGKSLILSILTDSEEDTSEKASHESFLHESTVKRNWKKMLSTSIYSLIPIVLLFIQKITLSLKLDEFTTFSWWIIFIPLILLQIYMFYGKTHVHNKNHYLSRQEPQFLCKIGFYGYLLRNYYPNILFIINTILLITNLDHYSNSEENANWWFIFSPAIIWIIAGFVLNIIETCWYLKLKRKKDKVDEEAQIFDEPPGLIGKAISIGFSVLINSFLLIFLILIIVWMSKYEISAFIVFIPIFLVIFCSCCVCLCCVFPLYYCYLMAPESTENNPNPQ